MKKNYKAVMKCKSFYVGDPCYVTGDDVYDKYCCSCNDLSGDGDEDGGIGRTPDGIVVCVVHCTDHGDGEYDGYFVDSGQIGIVNGDFTKDCKGYELTEVPSGEAEVELEYEDGCFDITVTDHQSGKILFDDYIDTCWEEDDEEEDDE